VVHLKCLGTAQLGLEPYILLLTQRFFQKLVRSQVPNRRGYLLIFGAICDSPDLINFVCPIQISSVCSVFDRLTCRLLYHTFCFHFRVFRPTYLLAMNNLRTPPPTFERPSAKSKLASLWWLFVLLFCECNISCIK